MSNRSEANLILGDKIDDFTRFINVLADAAAPHSLRYFRSVTKIHNKENEGGFDPVTEADRSTERAIRALIETHYPEHGIMGEEYGMKNEHSPWRWIIDPIDGTRAFISGLPVWGTLIALCYEGQPLIGLVDQPFLKERYMGAPGYATLNGQIIKTRQCKDLAHATITTTDPYLFNGQEIAQYEKLLSACNLSRYGLDCYGYMMLSSGFMDIAIESGLQPYDVAALIPIIKGAGGQVSNWQGDTDLMPSDIIACGDPALHDQVIECLAKIQIS